MAGPTHERKSVGATHWLRDACVRACTCTPSACAVARRPRGGTPAPRAAPSPPPRHTAVRLLQLTLPHARLGVNNAHARPRVAATRCRTKPRLFRPAVRLLELPKRAVRPWNGRGHRNRLRGLTQSWLPPPPRGGTRARPHPPRAGLPRALAPPGRGRAWRACITRGARTPLLGRHRRCCLRCLGCRTTTAAAGGRARRDAHAAAADTAMHSPIACRGAHAGG